MTADRFRGISKVTGEWVYGDCGYNEATGEMEIAPPSGAPLPIDPATLSKRMMVGSASLYHGDLVMWCKFRRTKQAPQCIEDILFGEIGVVHQEGNIIRIAQDIFSCGVMPDGLDERYIKVVGSIFETGLYLISEDFYTPPV